MPPLLPLPPPAMSPESRPPILQSKLFWVGILYFAQGFPMGMFYDVFPVYFRQQGVNLSEIGFLSLLGLAWTLKFLWAPAIDHFRHHRRWMAAADLGMGLVALSLAIHADFGPWVWVTVALFTLLSATNDIATDGYTIERLERQELGLANGLRIGLYRVGMLAAGAVLMLSDWLGWAGSYASAAALSCLLALVVLQAPREQPAPSNTDSATNSAIREELADLLRRPLALAAIIGLFLVAVALADISLHFSRHYPNFWLYGIALGALPPLLVLLHQLPERPEQHHQRAAVRGPLFGALLELFGRPAMLPVALFILTFKLGDTAMGFMVKPFWVDAGFSASEIGLVSVNVGLALSVAGGVVGGWLTDRLGIFHGLWLLGLTQALSNLGYAAVAWWLPLGDGAVLGDLERLALYSASGLESFTGGLGTGAFLAFLMAIVDRRRAATEYALLSSLFALSRSLAGWGGGFGAESWGYAPFFLFTFFLSFPAYLLLPWVYQMLSRTESGAKGGQ